MVELARFSISGSLKGELGNLNLVTAWQQMKRGTRNHRKKLVGEPNLEGLWYVFDNQSSSCSQKKVRQFVNMRLVSQSIWHECLVILVIHMKR